jgi:mono/diheme cytochrome c family protein
MRAVAIAGCMVALAAVAGCSEHMGRGWDWNRMRMQPKYEPYRDSRFFPDGKTMQTAPSGTISREIGAAAQWTSPRLTPALLQRGRQQFNVYCAVCHGERGDGNSIVGSNMEPPKPPSLLAPPATSKSDSVIAAIVANGLGSMPSFAAQMSIPDRVAVAEYVKTLQHASAGRPVDSATGRGASQP